MSSEAPTADATAPGEQPREGFLSFSFRCLVFAVLLSPVIAIQIYRYTPAEEVDVAHEINDHVTYVTGSLETSNDILEVNLGYFDTSVVRSEIKQVVRVRFHLAGLIADRDLELYEEFRTSNQQRFRDTILSELSRTPAKQLSDPRLSELRMQLTSRTNDMVGSHLFRNLIFSEFTMLKQ